MNGKKFPRNFHNFSSFFCSLCKNRNRDKKVTSISVNKKKLKTIENFGNFLGIISEILTLLASLHSPLPPALLENSVNCAASFLQSHNLNLKFLGRKKNILPLLFLGLKHLRQMMSRDVSVLIPHQMTILECLEMSDSVIQLEVKNQNYEKKFEIKKKKSLWN
jgi:hypothetical protein